MKITLTDDAGVEVVFVPEVKTEVVEPVTEEVLPELTELVQPVE